MSPSQVQNLYLQSIIGHLKRIYYKQRKLNILKIASVSWSMTLFPFKFCLVNGIAAHIVS